MSEREQSLGVRFVRVRSEQGIDLLAKHLLKDDDFEPGVFEGILKNILVQQKDNIFILTALTLGEKQEPLVKAFLIATADPGRDFVFIYQAWADNILEGRGVQNKMFSVLVQWATTLGRTKLRAETKRDPRGFLRRWGFEPYSEVLSLDLEKKFRDLSGVEEEGEVLNGIEQQQTKVDEHVESEPVQRERESEQPTLATA